MGSKPDVEFIKEDKSQSKERYSIQKSTRISMRGSSARQVSHVNERNSWNGSEFTAMLRKRPDDMCHGEILHVTQEIESHVAERGDWPVFLAMDKSWVTQVLWLCR